ncbi:DUF305 domain-containing protein [Actinokineospora cianjurensis]|uniref:Uncharacterized protein (DUF305 family) n=1 Tax=Actinokineospora cianjurensis TaxID=585224 RepID=A0A421B222_9PSEU|nr:DUF305 domain-containing protein [Actinokineospora cianjurensis]RLK58323.1 uncharacterized protein (DUF305 family) [Actinokineospora cianjurensis]
MTSKPLVRLALALLIALPACSAQEQPDHNQADVAFARGMVPHHQQAVDMAGLAAGRTTNPKVLALADRVAAAQDAEITALTRWLDDWGVSPQNGHSGHMDDSRLRGSTGADFDEEWLTLMTAHHEDAVAMSRAQLAEGVNADAKAMARRIIDAQQAEIDQMRELLR